MNRETVTKDVQGGKEIVRLNILQYMWPHASVIHQIPKFAKAMLIYTNFKNPIFMIRNNEFPTVVTPCFLNRQNKPNTRLFPYVHPHTIIITFLLCQPAQRLMKS